MAKYLDETGLARLWSRIKAAFAPRVQGTEYIEGTQTAATGAWTGVTRDAALYNGKQIAYWLPFAGSGNASLTLTLADGTQTAAVPCYAIGTTRLTTHFPAGSCIHFTYRENVTIGTTTIAAGWWPDAYYNYMDYNKRVGYISGMTGALGIWGVALLMRDGGGTYQSICTAADGTVTANNRTVNPTKKANPNGFEVGSPIWYSTTTYIENTRIADGYVLYSELLLDARYPFNVTRAVGQLEPYKPVYLTGTIHADGLYYLDDVWWTQTPTDTAKVYVLVGGCYDCTTSNVRIQLYDLNPWYVYDGTHLVNLYESWLSSKLPGNGG